MLLNSLRVDLDKEVHSDLGTTVKIRVRRMGEQDLHVQRIVPNNDFESYFDYVWDACKRILDEEIAK